MCDAVRASVALHVRRAVCVCARARVCVGVFVQRDVARVRGVLRALYLADVARTPYVRTYTVPPYHTFRCTIIANLDDQS